MPLYAPICEMFPVGNPNSNSDAYSKYSLRSLALVPRQKQNRNPLSVSRKSKSPCRVVRTHLKDLQNKLGKLLVDAEDCELIARLATDQEKRKTFGRLARQLRAMAA